MIVFRVDASAVIGSGHVMRCLALAETLSTYGITSTFCCRQHHGNMLAFIQSKGFQTIVLQAPKDAPGHSHASWLGATQTDDADEFLASLTGPVDAVIVDHYAIDQTWQKIVAQQYNNLIVIDDLADRVHHCSILIDQNLWPDMHRRYTDLLAENTVQLLGPEYAMLRSEFRQYYVDNIEKKDNVVVFFGGTDPTNECLKVMTALQHFDALPFTVDIVCGDTTNAFESHHQMELPAGVGVHKRLDNFVAVLAEARYAIGASGISNWERFCLRVPTTLVSVANNQDDLALHLNNEQLVRFLGRGNTLNEADYTAEISRLITRWPKVDACKELLVDGLGTQRIVRQIVNTCLPNTNISINV